MRLNRKSSKSKKDKQQAQQQQVGYYAPSTCSAPPWCPPSFRSVIWFVESSGFQIPSRSVRQQLQKTLFCALICTYRSHERASVGYEVLRASGKHTARSARFPPILSMVSNHAAVMFSAVFSQLISVGQAHVGLSLGFWFTCGAFVGAFVEFWESQCLLTMEEREREGYTS